MQFHTSILVDHVSVVVDLDTPLRLTTAEAEALTREIEDRLSEALDEYAPESAEPEVL